MTTIIYNDQTKEFFFSKEHSTPQGMGEEWIPVSWYTRTREQVYERETSYGYTEIPHPNPEFQA